MSRAKAFYESVLGVKLEALPGPDLEMQAFPFDPVAPGSGGALVRYQGKASGDGGTLVYFSCEDCAVQASRAAQNGGRIFREKFSIGQYGFIALVYDTEGNMVGLHSMR